MSKYDFSVGLQLERSLRDDNPPADPFDALAVWLADATARAAVPNPNAMALATQSLTGPAVRIVLCKAIAAEGYVVFYTNYDSRKGAQLDASNQAAVVFHFDHDGRQVRIEGTIVKSPTTESDQYFSSRHPASRIGAWASNQSRPIADKSALQAQLEQYQTSDVALQQRPPHWGGYRLWASAVELWCDGEARLHDRFRYERPLSFGNSEPCAGEWLLQRLQP